MKVEKDESVTGRNVLSAHRTNEITLPRTRFADKNEVLSSINIRDIEQFSCDPSLDDDISDDEPASKLGVFPVHVSVNEICDCEF